MNWLRLLVTKMEKDKMELTILAAAAIIGAGAAASGCSSRTAKDVSIAFCALAALISFCMVLINVFG